MHLCQIGHPTAHLTRVDPSTRMSPGRGDGYLRREQPARRRAARVCCTGYCAQHVVRCAQESVCTRCRTDGARVRVSRPSTSPVAGALGLCLQWGFGLRLGAAGRGALHAGVRRCLFGSSRHTACPTAVASRVHQPMLAFFCRAPASAVTPTASVAAQHYKKAQETHQCASQCGAQRAHWLCLRPLHACLHPSLVQSAVNPVQYGCPPGQQCSRTPGVLLAGAPGCRISRPGQPDLQQAAGW